MRKSMRKMSARNQLTDYELEQFFRSLRDLLILSLEANLSFDSAEFLSRRLDGFERTLNVLSSRLRVSFPTEVQLLVNRGSIARTYLTVNPLLSPPGGLFFSSTFEGGLNREGGGLILFSETHHL